MLRILKIFIVISTFALHLRNQSIQIKTPDLTGKFIAIIVHFRTSLWICSMEKNRTHSFRWVKCQFAISNNYKLWVMITIRNVTGFRVVELLLHARISLAPYNPKVFPTKAYIQMILRMERANLIVHENGIFRVFSIFNYTCDSLAIFNRRFFSQWNIYYRFKMRGRRLTLQLNQYSLEILFCLSSLHSNIY